MTISDQPTAVYTADATIARLRSGAPLTDTERAGLADLLDTVRRCHTMARDTGGEDYPVRSGLLLNVLARYTIEFGPVSSDTADDRAARGESVALAGDRGPEGNPRACEFERAVGQPGCGVSDADHPLCGCCPGTCDCPEGTGK